MTDDRSLERAARSWIEIGPTEAPERAVEAALHLIQTTPQVRALRIPWKFPNAFTPTRIATVAVIGALTIGGAVFIVGGPPVSVGVPPSPDPSHAVQPTPSASARSTPSPTISPLNSTGLIVFEHFTPRLVTRIEQLLPTGFGQELLPDVPGNQQTPSWSSDGARLAFAQFDPGDPASRQQIFETDATGSEPRPVTTDCRPPACLDESGPAYSVDGRQMVFVRWAGPLGGPPTSSVVAIRDLTTGAVTELESTGTPYAEAFIDHPRWSPDATHISFTRVLIDADAASTDSRIWLVNADGNGLRALTEPGFEAGDAEWSPDGTRILFAREIVHHWSGGGKGAGENEWIYTMAPDGTASTRLTSGRRTGAPSWTAGGSQILYSVLDASSIASGDIATPDIYVMEADGSNQRKVATYGDCCRWYPVQQPAP
jgi:Tol biopolymer transport system component